MRWMAALIWRLPQRSRRWRLVRPELAGIGAIPAARASLASLAKRSAPAISPTSLAAGSGPQPGAVIDQQPDVELRSCQRGHRQRLDPRRQRGPRDRDRVDAVRLTALTTRAPAGRHQPRRDAHHALTAPDQEPLQRARDVPTVL